jgi:hypothetical protein
MVDIRKLINEETMTTADAIEYLGITRQGLNKRVHAGHIEPLIEVGAGTLFLRKDIEALKQSIRKK